MCLCVCVCLVSHIGNCALDCICVFVFMVAKRSFGNDVTMFDGGMASQNPGSPNLHLKSISWNSRRGHWQLFTQAFVAGWTESSRNYVFSDIYKI